MALIVKLPVGFFALLLFTVKQAESIMRCVCIIVVCFSALQIASEYGPDHGFTAGS